MKIKGSKFILRPWKKGDEASLVENANNPKVWINLVDTFPHPYTMKDARAWIKSCQKAIKKKTTFAIEVDSKAVGGIGFEIQDKMRRKTANIGYWLGENYWGKGIATEALRLVSVYALRNFPIVRLQAGVYLWNPASTRVLEKAGYTLEGKLRKSITKNGKIADEMVYAKVK